MSGMAEDDGERQGREALLSMRRGWNRDWVLFPVLSEFSISGGRELGR